MLISSPIHRDRGVLDSLSLTGRCLEDDSDGPDQGKRAIGKPHRPFLNPAGPPATPGSLQTTVTRGPVVILRSKLIRNCDFVRLPLE